jgi:hypothetical protein
MSTPKSLFAAALACAALAGCGERNADTTDDTLPPTTDTAPPPVDPAVPGAPEGVLPAPPSTAPMLPAEDPTAAHFRRLDADGNGSVTPDEHRRGAAAMFAAMDADGDGDVTAAEMDAAQAALGGDARLSSAAKIQVIDANGDGILAREEHARGSRMMFATMDVDANGRLDQAEVRNGHDRMM